MKERKYEIGQHVVFVDSFGIPRDALITTWWSQMSGSGDEPGCNLVYVEGDPKREDSCGRQVSHSTSIVHRSMQPAHGNYWCWDDELTDDQRENMNRARF